MNEEADSHKISSPTMSSSKRAAMQLLWIQRAWFCMAAVPLCLLILIIWARRLLKLSWWRMVHVSWKEANLAPNFDIHHPLKCKSRSNQCIGLMKVCVLETNHRIQL